MNRNFNTFSSQSDNYKEAQTCELDKMPEEQAKAMMWEMGKLLKNLWEQWTLEEYYNRHYAEKSKNSFKWTTAQIKQLFSLLFIKNRDSETIKSDNLLEISLKNWWNLYVRDKNEKEFTTVSSWDIVKSLWETKKMRWLTYIKIEYTNSSWKKIEWYVSKNCVKKTTDELNNLNWYIRNLWTNPSRHVKENIFKNIDPIGRYRGTLDQNAMIYHYLVQKYEFNKFLKSSLKKEKTQKKANLLKQEITPVKTPVSSTQEQADSPSTNIPSANIAASVSAYERNENRTGLDSKNTAVITTIEAEDNKADKNNPNVRTASLGRIPIPISVIERMRRKLNKIEKEINAEADITWVESTADDTTSSEEIIPEPISDNSTPAEAHLEQQNDTPPQAVASIKNASPIPPKLSVEEEVSDIDKTSWQETTAVDTTETDKKPEISTEKTIKEQLEIRQELNKILTVKVLEIENKISSNEKIQAYLNKKYWWDFDKFLNNVFGVKSIYETDITLMAKAFWYLHINANNIFLYQYRKELNITEDKKDE